MKIALLALTKQGGMLAEILRQGLPKAEIVQPHNGVRLTLERIWQQYDGIVCIMAVGIVVRCLDGLCQSKYTDPCIVVLDEQGNHAISLLSGHIGGGNRLAESIGSITHGTAVISTASDVSGHTSVDLWSIANNLTVANPAYLTTVSARLLNTGHLRVHQDRPYIPRFPDDFKTCQDPCEADVIISVSPAGSTDSLHLMPRIHYIGFGCRRGATVGEFQQALDDLRKKYGLDMRTIAGIASIDLKNDEKGLCEIGARNRWPVRFFSKEVLNEVGIPVTSLKVYEKIGAYGVCEPAALLAASCRNKPGQLIIRKITWKRITAAVARRAD